MKEFNRLVRIMERLRHPRTGCPWDLRQTPDSLKDYLLEETYELIDAIDARQPSDIQEELGDLLLQIIFIAQIEKEAGHFAIQDVLSGICDKLVSRHPHIFARTRVKDAEEVKRNWERIKMKEKNKSSIISDYPDRMPALLTAVRISSQASEAGFDWNDALQALEKVKEEILELEKEIRLRRSQEAEQEMGDLLFALANVSRLLRINAEFALQKANRKFTERFRYIEKELKKQGKDPHSSDLAEMERLWDQAKRAIVPPSSKRKKSP